MSEYKTLTYQIKKAREKKSRLQATIFDEIPGAVFSDAANKALQRGLKEFIKEDWRKVFDDDNFQDQIIAIT